MFIGVYGKEKSTMKTKYRCQRKIRIRFLCSRLCSSETINLKGTANSDRQLSASRNRGGEGKEKRKGYPTELLSCYPKITTIQRFRVTRCFSPLRADAGRRVEEERLASPPPSIAPKRVEIMGVTRFHRAVKTTGPNLRIRPSIIPFLEQRLLILERGE